MGAGLAMAGLDGDVALEDQAASVVDPEYAATLARRAEFLSWSAKLKLHPDDLKVFLDDGFSYDRIPAAGTRNQKVMLAYIKKRGERPPKWSMTCGILPDETTAAEPKERRAQLRTLHRTAVLLIRRALARCEVDENKAERTIFWDPAIEVCREMEISQSKLSSLMKEFCGNSLIQVIDCVKVEQVRKTMRAELTAFLDGMKAEKEGGGDAQCATFATENEAWEIWKALKKARRWPEFTRDTWAHGMGFASYRRMYRACLAVFGKTPHQMEMEIIKELLAARAEQKADGAATEKVVVPDFMEYSLAEIEKMVREIPTYQWGT